MKTNETLEEQLDCARQDFDIALVNWKKANKEFREAEETYVKSWGEIYRIVNLIEEKNK
jgi:hypothetical protein